MKYHRTLTPDSLLRHGPAKIALMVASEFWRASQDADSPQDVMACYCRARELMGVLETIPLNNSAAATLKEFYRRCTYSKLTAPSALVPSEIRDFAEKAGAAFERVSGDLIAT